MNLDKILDILDVIVSVAAITVCGVYLYLVWKFYM